MHMHKTSLGAACINADPQYPNGCPSGFTLQQVYYVPNIPANAGNPQAGNVNVPASTPGAVPMPSNTVPGCTQYQCFNASNLGPYDAAQNACPKFTPMGMVVIAATAGIVLLLPGATKLLALPVFVVGALLSGQMVPVLDASGKPTGQCQAASSSW